MAQALAPQPKYAVRWFIFSFVYSPKFQNIFRYIFMSRKILSTVLQI